MINNITLAVNVDDLLLQALKEDITSEDLSTNAVMKDNKRGKVQLLAKQNGVIAGIAVFFRVFTLMDQTAEMKAFVEDGEFVKAGQLIAEIQADIKTLLSGERVALNYLQRMCGIATYTREIVKYLEGSNTRLLDTRKTTPNMRIFEKYAVKVGGGYNHRFNLSDGIILKDNHIAAAGGVKEAVTMAKDYAPFVRKVEVEVETLEMVEEALEAGADIIMLDNMSYDTMKEAIRIIGNQAQTECSGNVTKENIRNLAGLGVNYISSGALTHSAPILDISMKNLEIVK